MENSVHYVRAFDCKMRTYCPLTIVTSHRAHYLKDLEGISMERWIKSKREIKHPSKAFAS